MGLRGRDLPLSAAPGAAYSGADVAFSGRTMVGLVAQLSSSGAGQSDNILYAIRFERINGHWLIDYLHHGHSSTYVNETNFSPAGFLPGSHSETAFTWFILGGGVLALVVLVAFIDRRMSRSSRPLE